MLFPRQLLAEVEGYLDSPEAVILTGMRRTGKTTLLTLIRDRIRRDNVLFLDLENPLNRRYFEEADYERLRSALEVLGLDFARRPYVFLDEIQHVRTIPSAVKYLIDRYRVKFFLTGSASFYLRNLFTESLAGRKIIFEVFPLTFREFLVFKSSPVKIPESEEAVTESVHATLDLLYEEYMRYGGFPGVVLKGDAKEKARALEDIFTSFFQLEVLQLGDFRRNNIIRDLMLLLMQGAGSKLDIQRISRDLGVSRPTLNDYLAFLEGTYFVSRVRPFTRGRSTEVRKTPKIYICDTGIANRFARLDDGHVFENSVFQNLKVRGELTYYQRRSGLEIDFVLHRKNAYEVKVNPSESDMRKVQEMCGELGMESCRMVSKRFSGREGVTYGFML